MHFLHFLMRIADALPDSTRLGVSLCLLGGGTLAGVVLSPAFTGIWRERIYWMSLACLALGLFIFFRRGVLAWQEKRAKSRDLSMFAK